MNASELSSISSISSDSLSETRPLEHNQKDIKSKEETPEHNSEEPKSLFFSLAEKIRFIFNRVSNKFSIKIHLFILVVLKVLLGVFAWMLAWDCNQSLWFPFRTVISLVSSVFSEIYIIYYAFWRTIMGNKCY